MKKIAFMLISFYMGLMGANAQSNRYDVNADGNVNITDVIELVNYILGLNNGNPGDGGNETNATGEAIDLGLPSGTKWASCNVGATNPEEFGEYFAWGELEEKPICKETNYLYASGNGENESGYYVSNRLYRNLGSNIGGTEYDVAHVRWGGNWRMPTATEISELLNNCTSERTTLNGVIGRKFTGPNGNSIFLPAAGCVNRYGKQNIETSGYYWSSTPHSSLSNSAIALYFVSKVERIHFSRPSGFSVRPVWKE